MNIGEVRMRQDKLAEDIQKMVETFEKQTEIQIKDINILRQEMIEIGRGRHSITRINIVSILESTQ